MRTGLRMSFGSSAFKLISIAAALGCGCGIAAAQSQISNAQISLAPSTVEAPVARFKESIDAFAAADREKAPRQGGVLFVGSSTIRMWDTLETQFDNLPIVVRRGFGGSRMSDCTYYLGNLVTPYKPRLVVVYAGDNDLNEGATPQDVLKSYSDFVDGVRRDLPGTRIAYVSIKPSPSRANLIPAIRETNRLIENYSRKTQNLDYIDVFTAMMASDGQPRHELFGPDALHMNDAGYALWKNILATHVH
ncbi:SGNH/GDSL hydrolase family protein [soil metagenome]